MPRATAEYRHSLDSVDVDSLTPSIVECCDERRWSEAYFRTIPPNADAHDGVCHCAVAGSRGKALDLNRPTASDPKNWSSRACRSPRRPATRQRAVRDLPGHSSRGHLFGHAVAKGVRVTHLGAAVDARLASDVARHGPTRVVHELALCQAEARVDVAAINGRLVGFEIKTRLDTLARLDHQEAVYSRIFDKVWLVADHKHFEPAAARIPGWWGILHIVDHDGDCELLAIRNARLNRSVDPASVVRLLWRDEVLAELASLGLSDGLGRAPRRVLWSALAAAVPRHVTLAQLQRRVRERLKSRQGWRADERRMSVGGSS